MLGCTRLVWSGGTGTALECERPGDNCCSDSSSSSTAHLFPVKATQSVNVAEPATFSAKILKRKETDVMWKRNGKWPLRQAQGWGCSQPVPGAGPRGTGGLQVTLCPLSGTYYQTTDRGEVQGNLVTLTLPNVSVSENGVYSATFMGDSPLWSAFYRLIVRGECGPGSLGQGQVAVPRPPAWCQPGLPPLSSQPAPRRNGDPLVRRTVPTV